MWGAFLIATSLVLTYFTLWKRLTILVLATVGFWIATLSYVITNLPISNMQQQIVMAIAAVVGALFLYGMGKMPNWVTGGDNKHPLQTFMNKMNNEPIDGSRNNNAETVDEYRVRVHRALHPNRIKRNI